MKKSKLKGLVESVAAQLMLGDWQIDVVYDPALSADRYAEITVVPSREVAVLSYGEKIHALNKSETIQLVCHELLHCHLARMMEIVFDAGEAGMPFDAGQVFNKAVTLSMETAVEKLSIAVAWMFERSMMYKRNFEAVRGIESTS